MRWTLRLSVDAQILLCDSHQIQTAFNDLTHTYCSQMVNVECASKYDRIGGPREHGIVVSEVF